jgi:phenylacetate-CoA ligase
MASWPEPIESASVDELRALQLERLQWSVRHAYENVSIYRRKFDAAGVHPDDIASLDDVKRLPFTTKDDLREAYPFGMFAVPETRIVRVHASSGTTGKPTIVGYTREDIDMWSGLMARGLHALGARPGDKIHSSFGYGLFTGGLGWHYGAEKLGCMIVPASGGFTERQVTLIADLKPELLMATPSYSLVIADTAEKMGIDPANFGLRILISGAEPWSEEMRAEIEARFSVDAYDSYGLSEVIGPGVAQEAAGDKGALTLWEDHFWPEVIDPETGVEMPAGEMGEVVLTTLTRIGMPVIRYRTRDLTHLMPPMTRPMRRMARIRGRSDDMLIIRGVNIFPTTIEAILARDQRLSPHYQLEVTQGENHVDHLTVHVEARDATIATDASVGAETQHLIKSMSGVSVRVAVCAPGTIERSEGKAKRIIDRRPKT